MSEEFAPATRPTPIMEMSDQIDAIAKVLPKVQSSMGAVLKNANNPAFKSKYADLGAVIEAVVPALNQHGISLLQPASFNGDLVNVATMLLHESGQWVRCTLSSPLQKRDAQGIGSACTYLRRYGLQAMSGIAPEDDDGHSASQKPSREPEAKLSADQLSEIEGLIEQSGAAPSAILQAYGVRALADVPAASFAKLRSQLLARIEKNTQKEAA